MDYCTNDIDWPAWFHREITPRWLAATAVALGAAAPDVERGDFVWLELGCGAGLNALIGAACHSDARFVAVDVNPRAIERAQRIAAAVGLDNAEFICADLATLQPAALPVADFIVSMGTYSWAGEAARQGIERIIGSRLGEHGIACIGYMSEPGASAFASAREFMLQLAARTPGDSAAKAQAGMAALRTLAGAGAGFFVEHPAIARAITRDADRVGTAHLAHELLNADWQPLHVAQLMGRLRESAACRFIGSATPLENMDALSLPAATQSVLAQWAAQGADVAMLETARDLARNQRQRRDLFQKQSTPALSVGAHREALLAQRVRLLPPHAQLHAARQGEDLVLDTPIGAAALDWAHVAPIVAALQDGPSCSYAEMAQWPAYAQNPGFINQILQILNWAGIIHFVGENPKNNLEKIAKLEKALAENDLGTWQILPDAATALAAAASA